MQTFLQRNQMLPRRVETITQTTVGALLVERPLITPAAASSTQVVPHQCLRSPCMPLSAWCASSAVCSASYAARRASPSICRASPASHGPPLLFCHQPASHTGLCRLYCSAAQSLLTSPASLLTSPASREGLILIRVPGSSVASRIVIGGSHVDMQTTGLIFNPCMIPRGGRRG